jgi:hypothetical protein
MNRCSEFVLDDLTAVTAIPVADYNPDTASWQLTPTVPSAGFSPLLAHAVVIGRQPATAGGALIPIIRGTGKAKDAEGDSVAGRLHTVTVTCEVDDRESSVLEHLLLLERVPAHLVLTFRDGTRAFVQAAEDTYLCTVERDGAKTAVTLRIQDVMGIQMIA